MEYNNVMIDLETLGLKPNASVLCIAAVKFSFESDDYEKFQVNISQKSCDNFGLVKDKETVDWWVSERSDLLKTYFTNTIPLDSALLDLNDFIGPNAKKMNIWANGTVFDIGMLEWDYHVTGVACPWRYFNIMDARTVYKISGLDFKSYPRVGEYHNAIDDCLTQIKALKECLCD